jgi:hypothetical protein
MVGSSVNGGLLANDLDPDPTSPMTQPLTAWLDQAPAQGFLMLSQDGSFSYMPPTGFYGVVSFTYHARDSLGAVSNSATVALIINPSLTWPNPGLYPVEAVDDAYPVGQDPISVSAGNGVLANDVNPYLAVLKSLPTNGKMPSFNFDGSFSFAPSDSFCDAGSITFQYTVFGLNGQQDCGDVTLYPAVLKIWKGQGAVNPLERKVAQNPGSATVANLNNTNGDGYDDKDQDTVKKVPNGPGGSSDEVDLMKLVVTPPEDPNPGNNKVTLTFAGPPVKLWKKSTKEIEVPLTNGSVEFTVPQLKQTGGSEFYIEALAVSNSLRDIVITSSYLGATDTVKATAIWATPTKFRNKFTDTSLSADVYRDTTRKVFETTMTGHLGLIDASTGAKRTSNGMEMEFTVAPHNIIDIPGVRFDIAQDVEEKEYSWPIGFLKPLGTVRK